MTMPEWYDKACHCAAWLYIHGIVPDAQHDKNRNRIAKLLNRVEIPTAKPSKSKKSRGRVTGGTDK
jgi:hypothetical protein